MISKAKKFIFIHIPKCAGSSVKKLLRNENKLTFINYDDLKVSKNQLLGSGMFFRKLIYIFKVPMEKCMQPNQVSMAKKWP